MLKIYFGRFSNNLEDFYKMLYVTFYLFLFNRFDVYAINVFLTLAKCLIFNKKTINCNQTEIGLEEKQIFF